MRKITAIASALALSALLFGCSASGLTNTATAGDASVKYPDGWIQEDAGDGAVVLGIPAQAASTVTSEDGSCVVAIGDTTGCGTILDDLKAAIGNGEDTTVSGKQAFKSIVDSEDGTMTVVAVDDGGEIGAVMAMIEYRDASEDEQKVRDEIIDSFSA